MLGTEQQPGAPVGRSRPAARARTACLAIEPGGGTFPSDADGGL